MILVIGYGNELCGDDAVGPQSARALAELGLAGVECRDVPQLTPELADPIAQASAVVFVDAAMAMEPGQVQVAPLLPVPMTTSLGHLSSPHTLLALAEAVFGRAPSAWLITIGVRRLNFGDDPSPEAEQGVASAVHTVRQLIDLLPKTHVPSV